MYPETEGLSSRQLRRVMDAVQPLVGTVGETMPEEVVAEGGLMAYGEALREVHSRGPPEGGVPKGIFVFCLVLNSAATSLWKGSILLMIMQLETGLKTGGRSPGDGRA